MAVTGAVSVPRSRGAEVYTSSSSLLVRVRLWYVGIALL